MHPICCYAGDTNIRILDMYICRVLGARHAPYTWSVVSVGMHIL